MKKQVAVWLLAIPLLISFGLLVFLVRAQSRKTPSRFFVENRGQFSPEVRYRLEGAQEVVWVLEDELWITIREPTTTSPVPSSPLADSPQDSSARALNLRIRFPGSSPSHQLSPGSPVDIHRNYLTPAGQFDSVPLWDSIRYTDLYSGIDLKLLVLSGRAVLVLSSDAGNAPLKIELAIAGAEQAFIRDGRVFLRTEFGDLELPLYSEIAGLQVALSTGGGETLLFRPPAPDASGPAAADSPGADSPGADSPDAGTLIYGTYYGIGGKLEYATQVVSDSAGRAYAAGGADPPFAFTARPGVYTPLHLITAFVIRLNAAGTAADYVTTITGLDANGEDFATALAVDSSGSAYVAGLTSSTDFPTTPGAYDESPNGGNDVWVARLDASGSVIFATVMGTPAGEWANAIDLGIFNEIYVTGFTKGAGFPTTSGAYDESHNGGYDVFVAKLSSDGTTLLAGTFIGGSADDGGNLNLDRSGIVVDSVGSAYITGPTSSTNFPKTNPLIGTGGCKDIYVAKFSPGLDTLYFSTRLGGSGASCGLDGDDNAEKLALDSAGNIYIAGYTSTENGNGFPTTAGAYDTTYNGTFDGFLLKLNPTASTVLYGTFIGGSSVDVLKDIGLDSGSRVYLTGYTYSTDFPVSGDAYATSFSGGVDSLIVKIQTNGAGAADLVYSTYFGGTGIDQGLGIDVFGQDILYLSGLAGSADFPITSGSFQDTYSGDQDAYIDLFHLPNPVPPVPTPAWTPAPFNLNLPITTNE